MRATEQLIEESREDHDDPSLRIDQRDDLSGDAQQVGGDPQDAVALGCGGAQLGLAATGVRCAFDTDQTNRMVRTLTGFAGLAEQNDFIAENPASMPEGASSRVSSTS